MNPTLEAMNQNFRRNYRRAQWICRWRAITLLYFVYIMAHVDDTDAFDVDIKAQRHEICPKAEPVTPVDFGPTPKPRNKGLWHHVQDLLVNHLTTFMSKLNQAAVNFHERNKVILQELQQQRRLLR
jgi:hypothetical protein